MNDDVKIMPPHSSFRATMKIRSVKRGEPLLVPEDYICAEEAAERDRYHDLARRLARVADAANEWRMWNDVSDELHEALDALNSDDLAALLGDDGT
jgi:hypothetical protein